MQANAITPISPAFVERSVLPRSKTLPVPGWRVRGRVAKRRAVLLAGMLALSGATLAADGAPTGAGGDLRVAAIKPPAGKQGMAMIRPSHVKAGATNPLDRRIALLARELDLDAAQKLKARSLLEGQREQIVRIWQDESVPGALRVARTHAISERTEDGIRALLTDAQRQKYFKPRTDRVAIGGTSDDLATYVDKMNRR